MVNNDNVGTVVEPDNTLNSSLSGTGTLSPADEVKPQNLSLCLCRTTVVIHHNPLDLNDRRMRFSRHSTSPPSASTITYNEAESNTDFRTLLVSVSAPSKVYNKVYIHEKKKIYQGDIFLRLIRDDR